MYGIGLIDIKNKFSYWDKSVYITPNQLKVWVFIFMEGMSYIWIWSNKVGLTWVNRVISIDNSHVDISIWSFLLLFNVRDLVIQLK